MSVQVKRRRDTAANVAAYTGAQGELIVDTTNNRVTVHDGSTPGGWPAAKLSEVPTTHRTAISDANYAVLASDRIVAFTALTAARTVTLPSAASFPVGTALYITDESGACSGTNYVAVNRSGSDTIVGATSTTLNGPYQVVALESNGSNAWGNVASAANETFSTVGIGAPPDASNPLSVKAGQALFNALSASFTVYVNKTAAANNAAVLFEDAFAAKAQIGLLGDDNFHIQAYTGSSWLDALVVNYSTGKVTLTQGLAAGTATQAPLILTAGTNLTTAAAGAIEYDGVVFYSSVAASERGVIPSEQFVYLAAAYTLTSQTAAQKLFNATTNGALTLAAGTYQFECLFSLSGMSTSTSGAFGFALGGAATFTQAWWATANKAALATASSDYTTYNTAANTALTAANTTATGYALIKGVITVTVAGTVIPQVSLGVAAAAAVGAASYFKISPLGSSVTHVGNWS